ncbi:MAG TPA: HAD-IIB family hydrolase [Burkholderiales bacterium]|nr:HAD-IIB family hydrolase [Burkholderiales bacterium]
MRYLALATDYDGTIAHHGRVDEKTVEALKRVATSGRKLLLVTGRQLPELLEIFPEIDMFDLVVAENGALLYTPATKEQKLLAEAPPDTFVEALNRRGVPIAVGGVIVATVHPHETVVLETIRDLGLELQVIFNKGSVMVLPPNVNKASGLMAALDHLCLSPHNVVAVGDAENDHALLNLCEYSAAVANSVPMLKAEADLTTDSDHGAGVAELIEALITNELATPLAASTRRKVLLGRDSEGEEIHMPPACINLLVAGSSGSGKSTLATGVLERLAEQNYQFCIIDPEGDYENFEEGIVFGSGEHGPGVNEVLTALEKPDSNVIVNLIGLPLQDRPAFFLTLLPRLLELRARTGRPHWILVDETHHLMPTDWESASSILTQDLSGMIYITVHPDWIAPAVLQGVNVIATLGTSPDEALMNFAKAIDTEVPSVPLEELQPGEALLWLKYQDRPPFKLSIEKSRSDRRRHRRKYAEGELPPDRSFYFRGPEDKLNLRAQNLVLFTQIAEGVDEETWLHHLQSGDYSQWLRKCVKDETLADEVAVIEQAGLSATESRLKVKEAIEAHYTVPAGGGSPAMAIPQ